MAQLISEFDKMINFSGTTSTKDDWWDLGTIPNGKQWVLGFSSNISPDKFLIFEYRANKAGQSTGTLGNTDLLAFVAVQGNDGRNEDHTGQKSIIISAPRTLASDGSQKLWLRTKSGTNTAGTFEIMLWYYEV